MYLTKKRSRFYYLGVHYWLLAWFIFPNFLPCMLFCCLYNNSGSSKKEKGNSVIFRVVCLNGWGGRIYWKTWLKWGFRITWASSVYIRTVFEAIKSWWLISLEIQEKAFEYKSREVCQPILVADFTVIFWNISKRYL